MDSHIEHMELTKSVDWTEKKFVPNLIMSGTITSLTEWEKVFYLVVNAYCQWLGISLMLFIIHEINEMCFIRCTNYDLDCYIEHMELTK